jgi:hypothetical protein
VVACFPYAQHFITSQVPTGTQVHTVEQLQQTLAAFNASPPSQGFSSKKIRAGVLAGGAVSFLITSSLIAWIALHYAFAH